MEIPDSPWLLRRMFVHPEGLWGRLGGWLMARSNRELSLWTIEALEIRPQDRVLEVGFGPGEALYDLSRMVTEGRMFGIDASRLMVERARKRNRQSIDSGRMDLQEGSVMALPYAKNSFDKIFAINSLPFWPDPVEALGEIRRVLSPAGIVVLMVQPRWARTEAKILEMGKWMEKTLLRAGSGPVSVEIRPFSPVPALRALVRFR